MTVNNSEIDLIVDKEIYTHPKEYFLVQICMAQKAVELQLVDDLPTSLVKYTAIYRRITDKKYNPDEIDQSWQALVLKIKDLTTSEEILDEIWASFTANSKHKYEDEIKDDGHHFGSFIYKDEIIKSSGEPKISLHFDVHNRGKEKSDYSRIYSDERKEDLKRMFLSIKKRFQENPNYRPKTITLGSWMNNLLGVQEVLPTEFVESSVDIYPPEISFNGDSMWGQFLKLDGSANKERVQLFLAKLAEAKNTNDIVESLPVPVLLFEGKAEDFFNFYGIE